MHEFVKTFLFLLAVIDPLGAVPVFLRATRSFDDGVRKKVALRATLLATLILLFFVVAGQIIMEAMEISIPAFQIAGGLVLFLFSLTMIFEQSHGKDAEGSEANNPALVAVFPVAMPGIASPGAMLTVVLLTDNHVYSILQQARTMGIVLIVVALTGGLLLAARKVQQRVGEAGIHVVSRIMGLLLAAFAVQNILEGIREYFHL